MADLNALIVEHWPLARRIASRKTTLDREEACGVATVALVEAAQRFDPGRGVPFGAFVSRRIVGALIDAQRSAGLLSKRECRRVANGEALVYRVLVPLEEAPEPSCQGELADPIVAKRIAQALMGLTARERDVVRGRYWGELSNETIAARHRLTSSRISQMHTQAMARLRPELSRCA